jgi:asparagine synthase (glutamine-hydrolysing)
VDQLLEQVSFLVNEAGDLPERSEKIRKLISILPADSPEALYRRLSSHWQNPAEIVIDASEPGTVFTNRSGWANLPDFTLQMMYLDLVTYLPDDIFTKVDRASMAASLESRAPFLDDHRVVEFAWQLPLAYKVNQGQGKWVLRKVLEKYAPLRLFERPKMGFAIPIHDWLRGPLQDWAEALLDESILKSQGYLNPKPIRKKWEQHLSGRWNWQYHLWDVLMFQAWLQDQSKGRVP